MTELYVIVDPEHCAGRNPLRICEDTLLGGTAMLQLRAKQLCDRELLTLACAMRERCRDFGVPFWINDRADLALLSEADGLHLGQDDLPVSAVRQLCPTLRLGLSTHSLEQAAQAASQDVSLIGFGPIFGTQSKARPSPTVGLAALGEVCRTWPTLDVVAIGGITAERAGDIARSGARYAAVISAVGAADDPRRATEALCAALAQR